jgi:hypothetical protein
LADLTSAYSVSVAGMVALAGTTAYATSVCRCRAMSGTRKVMRCLSCGKRIRPSQPHIEVADYETGAVHAYHGRPRQCRERALEVVERGKVYMASYHHVCGDEASGFACAGGCFVDKEALSAS